MESLLPKNLRFPDINISKLNHTITERKCKWIFITWEKRRLKDKYQRQKPEKKMF